MTRSDFSTGGYGDSNDNDERMWAAAELWETTGEAAFLTDFETRAPAGGSNSSTPTSTGRTSATWACSPICCRSATAATPTLVASLQSSLIATADALARMAAANSYGRPLGYYWGANGAVARTAMNLAAANALSARSEATRTRSSAGSITCSAAITTIARR